MTNSSLYWYVSDQVTGPYYPIDNDDSIVAGSTQTRLYGTTFLQTASEPAELLAYGWYYRLHRLEVSRTFRVLWTGETQMSLQRDGTHR